MEILQLDKPDKPNAVFFNALKNYTKKNNSAWHTPGHNGGAFFLRSKIGNEFRNFVGENFCKADLSVSVEELGTLLNHTGKIGEAERNAARTFGADETYFVLGGTSAASQIIFDSCVTKNDVAVIDRNCHKSIFHALINTDAYPIYLSPLRNKMGITGPIPQSCLAKENLLKAFAASPILKYPPKGKPKILTLTNSNYDGVCAETSKIMEYSSAYNLHFDEAWFAHAKFSPVYNGFYALFSDLRAECPIFVSQSTHKMLSAFSQGSMMHVRQGKSAGTFPGALNEAYAMHTSTSPQYNILASLDATSAIMASDGARLAGESILLAVELRRKIAALHSQFEKKSDWYFGVWQPNTVETPDGKKIDFFAADAEFLATHQSPWIIKAGDDWHGFSEMKESDKALLDPLKVTITTPGFDVCSEKTAENGIPAKIVARFLTSRGIVCEKTDFYSFLMLHSLGIEKAQHERLLNALDEFKKLYDENAPLSIAIPELAQVFPQEYADMGLRDHCEQMHQFIKNSRLLEKMNRAFRYPPTQKMKPSEAFRKLVGGDSEYVAIRDIPGRTSAVAIIPYPPGVPLVFGGEIWEKEDCAIYNYLIAWEAFENTFPGYEIEIMGIERRIEMGQIVFYALCLKN